MHDSWAAPPEAIAIKRALEPVKSEVRDTTAALAGRSHTALANADGGARYAFACLPVFVSIRKYSSVQMFHVEHALLRYLANYLQKRRSSV